MERKIIDLTEHENNSTQQVTMDVEKVSRSKSDNIEVKRINQRISILLQKASKYHDKLISEKIVDEDMDNYDVQVGLVKIKDLIEDYKELERNMDQIIIDSVGLVNEEKLDYMKSEIINLNNVIEYRLYQLESEDKRRGLFSLINKNVPKGEIVFPDAFSGAAGEDVHDYERDFRQALQESQTRQSSRLKLLMKYLTGSALEFVKDRHVNLDSALKALVQQFGNKQQIWNGVKENFRKRFDGKFKSIWGSYGDEIRIEALEHVIGFISNSLNLAEKYPDLSQEIFHSTTYDMICHVIPDEYYKGFNDLMGGSEVRLEIKLLYLQDYLRSQQGSAYRATGRTVSKCLSEDGLKEYDNQNQCQEDQNYRRDMWWLNYRRKMTYDKMRNEESCSSVQSDYEVYESSINEFVTKYKELPNCDGRVWKKRLRSTKNDVKDYVSKSRGKYFLKSKLKSRSSIPSKGRLNIQNLDYSSSDESVADLCDTNTNVDSARPLDVKEIERLCSKLPNVPNNVIGSEDCSITGLEQRLHKLKRSRLDSNDKMSKYGTKVEKIKLPAENSTRKCCENITRQVESKEEHAQDFKDLNYQKVTKDENDMKPRKLNLVKYDGQRPVMVNVSTQTDGDDANAQNCQVAVGYPINNQGLLVLQTIFLFLFTMLKSLTEKVNFCQEEIKLMRCYAQYNYVLQKPDRSNYSSSRDCFITCLSKKLTKLKNIHVKRYLNSRVEKLKCRDLNYTRAEPVDVSNGTDVYENMNGLAEKEPDFDFLDVKLPLLVS